MHNEKIRAWWFAKQGLDQTLSGCSARQIFSKVGWARSVGGANPYLTVHARTGIGRAQMDSDLAAQEIMELPSARGCTYVLGSDDFELGLKVGTGFSDEAAIKTAIRFLGVTEDEIERLCDAVLAALSSGPLDPKDIKAAVGTASRHLGDEGKKRGQTTTLPLALGRLQQSGAIRRISAEGRFDRQRYLYGLWGKPTGLQRETSRDEAFETLARRYFEWIGPATLTNFQWFSGLGAGVAKKAIANLNLTSVDETGSLLMLPDELSAFGSFEVPSRREITLISSLDSLLLLRRDVSSLLEPADADRIVPDGEGRPKSLSGSLDMTSNVIVDRGRIIGIWEFDPEAGAIVSHLFVPKSSEIEAAIGRTEEFITSDLGDCRSFSLDSPESRKPLLAALRSLD